MNIQTFLPYPNLEKSLDCLDNNRLRKQALETAQILGFYKKPKSYISHPVFKSWVGYEKLLENYLYLNLQIYFDKNRVTPKFEELYKKLTYHRLAIKPVWFSGIIHDYHKINLYHKDNVHYSEFKTDKPALNIYPVTYDYFYIPKVGFVNSKELKSYDGSLEASTD